MKFRFFLFPLIAILVTGCNGSAEEGGSDEEKVRDEVRSYLFLEDSIPVKAEITDTILVSELDGMIGTVEENLRLIQLDIDTLGTIIDTVAYQNMEYEKHLYPESIEEKMAGRNLTLTKHKLKMADLQAKKLNFQQTKRVLLHLRRSQLKSIAGYQVSASYTENNQPVDLLFLMNTEFRIID